MLLALDIGNSTITAGVFSADKLIARWVFQTVRQKTADEIGSLLRQFFSNSDLDFRRVSAVFISSVVTELDFAIRRMTETYFGLQPIFLDHRFDFGLGLDYQPPSGIGADRLVAAFAAVEKYGFPCIVCDFGTATTIDYVDSEKVFRGGIITPGMRTLSDSLFEKTSKLPRTEISRPEKVIANSTLGSIRSGVYFGYIGLVDGIIRRMLKETKETPPIISTGGLAKLIAEASELVEIIEEDLLLEGLRLAFERDNGK
ncbi:MAG: type III pantothenate kinase [Pyrinomonadaceae bacterium]